MPTLNQIETRVDSKLLSLWTMLQVRQETYFQGNGLYWQGINTPVQIPEFSNLIDNPRNADIIDRIAGSHSISWDTILPEIKNSPLSAQFAVDNYESPFGHGYQLTAKFLYEGRLFMRIRQHGPETERNTDWLEMSSE